MEHTNPRERVEWLTEQYDLSTRNAEALILTELGFSHSGIASKLGVTPSTARSYLRNLEDIFGEYVTQTLPKPVRYPTFPQDDTSEVDYSPDKIDLSPEFRDREKPINRGTNIKDIDNELITIEG